MIPILKLTTGLPTVRCGRYIK